MNTTQIQFCSGDRDITGDFYAAMDATEVRAWTEDGTLLGAVTSDGSQWRASASDVGNWTELEHIAYDGWQAALAALLASFGETLPRQ